jgi:radical SAM superfamily enzyme YgiQ (UPF0313 family)
MATRVNNLGVGGISSFLKKHGVETVIIDALKESLDAAATLKRIREARPGVVGISCLTSSYGQAVAISRATRQEGIPVVIGGVHPTFLPESTLKDSGADFVICGEGEMAFLKLIQAGLKKDGIPGVCSLQDFDDPAFSPGRGAVVEDLDDLPFTDWDASPPYVVTDVAVIKTPPAAVVITSRGCPHHCSFCASPGLFGHRARLRSPENVVEEIELLVKRFGIREIEFLDDNITSRRDHVEGICRQIQKKGLKISWACPNGIRADRVDRDLLRLMAQSGCHHVAVGVESLDGEILEGAGKGESVETILKAIEMAEDEGITTLGHFILGLPGETPQTLAKTIEEAARSRLSRAYFHVLDVLPGSALWDSLQGQFTPDWGKDSFKEPDWTPPGLSAAQVKKARARALRRFYLRPRQLLDLLKSIRPSNVGGLIKKILFQNALIG